MDQLWACDLEHLRAYADRVLLASEETEKSAALFFQNREDTREVLTVAGDTAIIDIRGMLTNRPSFIGSFLGFNSTSYTDIQAAIDTVQADDTIKRVRLIVDSPGGNVTGLDETWIALSELAKTREIVAENHGLIASAAYWLASAAQKITATSPSAETGSIGIFMLKVDFSKMDQKDGVKEIRIVSKNAPLKDPNPATKEGLKAFQDRLDAQERIFIARVAAGRGVSTETVEKDFGRGGLLIAADPDPAKPSALSVGMIDEVTGALGAGKGKDSRTAGPPVDMDEKKVEKGDISTAPADSGKVEKMKLAEVGKNDPELQAEIDASVAAAVAKAVKPTPPAAATPATPPEPAKPSTVALKALEGDASPYIKALAAKVITGDATEAELQAAQAALDAVEEARKAALAAGETEAQGDTPPAPPAAGTEDGDIKTEDDMSAQVARFRKLQGRKEDK